MPRYKITIEYDGTHLAGWQRQKDRMSIQQLLEEAITAFCQEHTDVYGSGRTDAGVHALGQVAHFDISKERTPYQVRQGLNHHLLKSPVSILDAEVTDESFHARFNATERHYLYRIINRPSPLVIERNRAWHVYHPLNIAAMQEAATVLVGHHDFTSFRSTECQSKSPVKTLDEIRIEPCGTEEIRLFFRARSFLHHQVRNMVGTLTLVGEGKWSQKNVQEALKAKDRAAAGPTAPPEGLYLHHICY